MSMEKTLWGVCLRTWYLMKEDGVGEPSTYCAALKLRDSRKAAL